jgi:HlyD family secretion protein
MRTLIVILVGLLIRGGSGGAVVCFAQNAKPARGPAAAAATRQPKKIVATGTVEPVEVVDVSSEVTGRIVTFGVDPHDAGKPIDHGSSVEVGTVLARIDPRLYEARVEGTRAGYKRAEAELTLAKVNLKRAETHRVANIQKGGSPDVDVERAAFELDAAKASVAAAEASVLQSKAALDEATMALDSTIIKSPIKGVVIDRRVNVGQTVPGDLNAPTLFLIADLEKLQVWASVNEKDIARVHVGQAVRFTVDAMPGKTFDGKVAQIRLNAQMVQNTVAYTVVVGITPTSEKLLPYLTARVEFQ